MTAYLLSALCLLIGLLFLTLGMRGRSSLPFGRIVYIDSKLLKSTAETFYDPEIDLAGRPDFLIKTRRATIPVELKSSPAPPQPHDGHILQLAAYCHLVESALGHRPPYGIVRYRDRAFRINYTSSLRKALLKALAIIRQCGSNAPDRSHGQPQRCRSCVYQTSCDQSLV